MRRSLFQSAPLNGVPLFRNVHCVSKAFVSGTLGFVVSGSCACGTVALVANRSSHSVAPASSAFCRSSRNTVTNLGQYASSKTQRRTFCRVPRQDLGGKCIISTAGALSRAQHVPCQSKHADLQLLLHQVAQIRTVHAAPAHACPSWLTWWRWQRTIHATKWRTQEPSLVRLCQTLRAAH